MRLPAIAALVVCALPAAVHAQTVNSAARVEVELGAGMLGGAELGTRDASLRANNPTLRPYRLFTSDDRFARSTLFHVKASVAITRVISVEGGVAWGHPDIRSAITGDVEGAPSITSAERVDQYFIDGGLVLNLNRLQLGGLVPFLVAGGGYLRQLHEGQTLIEQGQVYHAGGGFRYPLMLHDRGIFRSLGLKASVRLHVLRRGISFDAGPRPHVAASGSLFVGF